MHYQKHFTLEEARHHIPELRKKLIIIRNLSLKLKAIGFDIYKGQYKQGFHPGTLREFPSDFEKIKQLIKKIYDLGIEVKGVEQGLVDFPAIRANGEEVYLCWKMDEDDIEFWHRIPDGIKGRRHIDDF
ncbi:MAG: DUF2203 family protein [Calditrichaeota bacterium]|nr:MAG: DUF2203 family protein [Calditrichota bacterium]MBL1206132.1 DUF2203 family protein [Calditrichota bacterium]NOG45957.1 DUF2203 domain-containing protein [Calditrichota bacterium]